MQATIETIEALAHTKVAECYQCGKCTAGCPMAERMDVTPSQLVRLVQMGRIERAAASEAIWKCVSCLTCSTRCPQSVNCTGVIDALRQVAVEENQSARERARTVVFQEVFLHNIRKNGRLNELDLVRDFKLKGFARRPSVPFLFKDAMLAPQMIKRGKFHLKGEKVRDRDVVRRIFERCENGNGALAG